MLASLLEPGRELSAVDGVGQLARLAVQAHEGETVRARSDRELVAGTIVTARLSEGADVVFVQLMVESASGDDALLRLVDAVRLPSERWLERSTYSGEASVTVAGQRLSARVLDATPVGLRVATGERLEVGEIVVVRLGEEVELQARVIRSTAAGAEWEIAAEVIGLSQTGWVALERLLERRDPDVR
jgi:hypothetical protein